MTVNLSSSTAELRGRDAADSHSSRAAPAADAPAAPPRAPADLPRVLIITENASLQFGGEAVLPLHYFRRLFARGAGVWMITNHRNKAELERVLSPEELAHVRFAPNRWWHRALFKTSRVLPPRVYTFLIGSILGVSGQLASRRIARPMIRELGIEVVHQPTPVSPKVVSVLHGLGVPAVIGPMNGGMRFPPAFRGRERVADRVFNRVGRGVAQVLNQIFPGKLRAEVLLVANERTRAALPRGTRGHVEVLVENGVDPAMWKVARPSAAGPSAAVRLITVGRMVSLKGIDLLLHAMARVASVENVQLEIVGDGPERSALERLAAELGIDKRVTFSGWLSQPQCADRLAAADVFVLPSLHECGGAAVLEAMAAGLPCVATKWGGPVDYLDESCGVLIEPSGREQFISGLAEAMLRLARDPALRRQLGAAGRERTAACFDWERKIDSVVGVYKQTLRRTEKAGR